MANVYLIQLIGVILAGAGLIGLTASAHVFGARLSPAEKQRASDEWNRRGNTYRLPVNPEDIISGLFLLGGIGILVWSRFDHCGFLTYWLPSLPTEIKLLLSCR